MHVLGPSCDRSLPRAVSCFHTNVYCLLLIAELLAISPSTLIRPESGGDTEQEARMWDCFAEVYEKEVQQLQQGSSKELPTEKKRQILADILVWAEITQAHYDSSTAS